MAIKTRFTEMFEGVAHLVNGVLGREGQESGDTDHGVWSAGMAQGLIHDAPTVRALVDRIVAEAEDPVRGRLAAMVV
jgi:nitronate monooxygenase